MQKQRIIEIQQFEEASQGVFQKMVTKLVKDLGERCIFEEKKRHKKEFKIATRHERDCIIYDVIQDFAIQISKKSIEETKISEKSEYEDALFGITGDLVENTILKETYNTVFEEVQNHTNHEAEI